MQFISGAKSADAQIEKEQTYEQYRAIIVQHAIVRSSSGGRSPSGGGCGVGDTV